ncbi:MAG: MobF family relaxase [Propionibacteriaceae bacterium]
MSLKKIAAGSGYDYLVRQVAAQDVTIGTGLAAYYAQKGETPGVWMGSGLVGLDGIESGDPVTEAHMKALFGHGLHPLADEIRQAALEAGASELDAEKACRLGRPFAERAPASSPFHEELRRRYADANRKAGRTSSAPLDADVRAGIRSQVAFAFFVKEYGRPPSSPRELHGAVARWSRPAAATVAGFDLTLSPVKSVSTWWALAGLHDSQTIEQLHQEAVRRAAEYLETRLFTRVGPHGIRNVETRGMVAVAFTHRDSRAGDPDLHTHLVIANKVQTLDDRWYAVNARLLYEAKVAASETYNTVLERGLAETFGVGFVERSTVSGKRPVREVAGIAPELNARWSTRRGQIEHRRDELASAFLADHGRPPTEAEMIGLAQQANLETRDAKHAPRSLAEQRAAWRAEAEQVLGAGGVARMLAAIPGRSSELLPPTRDWMLDMSAQVIDVLEHERTTWQVTHLRAEALRQSRTAGVAGAYLDRVVGALVDLALIRSVPLAAADPIQDPDSLTRRDGESVYTVPGETRYTSQRILVAEQRILAHAAHVGGRAVTPDVVDIALLEAVANGTELTPGQADLVRSMAMSGRRVQLAIAPAGTGKTTAMRTLAAAWTESGGTVVGLAPSAAAARALADQLDAPCDTLAKLIWHVDHPDQPRPGWLAAIGPDALVVIDEAGMADTLSLDQAIAHVVLRGGSVRLVGDDRQLSAIGAGGVLRDIEAAHGACRLTEVLRFSDPAEAAATLALRDGKAEALGFYLDHGRIHVGDAASSSTQLLEAWAADRSAGLDALMLAPTRDLVRQLNLLAQQRHSGALQGPRVDLADGTLCTVGDVVITRRNNRRLVLGRADWVKNGDRWQVTQVSTDGGLRAQSLRTNREVRLPASYVRDWVDLGYATTIHGAQGITADTMHGLATGQESRQELYTMLTRGKHSNHLYLQVVGDGDPHTLPTTDAVHLLTAVERLERILGRDDLARSATTLLRDQHDPALLLAPTVARYADAIGVAAEHVLGPDLVRTLDQKADHIVLWLSESPAWPTLRADLLGRAADGHDPVDLLRRTVDMGDLDAAHDPAAVLDHRLDLLLPDREPGPLPWLRGIPDRVASDPVWGPYLQARAARIDGLAAAVRLRATAYDSRRWLGSMPPSPHAPEVAAVWGDIAVWRAATGVPPEDERPTGGPAQGDAACRWQRELDDRLVQATGHQARDWVRDLASLNPALAHDWSHLAVARWLGELQRQGLDVAGLVKDALTESRLPDDYAASALMWRIVVRLQGSANPSRPTPEHVRAHERARGRNASELHRTGPGTPAPGIGI